MEEIAVIAIGAAGVILYNTFSEPVPKSSHDSGTKLPCPRQLYSNPAQWTGSPVDLTYRQSETFYGPGNDPRRRYLLPGGTRVVHQAWSPCWVQTNQVWRGGQSASKQPSGGVPSYEPAPVLGTGEKRAVTSKTILQE